MTSASRWMTYCPGAMRSPVGLSLEGSLSGTVLVVATPVSEDGVMSSIWLAGIGS